jgi:magnesium transporter
VEFGEVHLFVGPDFVISIRHAESPDLAAVRGRMEATPELLRLGPEAVLYAILDRVVDEYEPVIAGLENDLDQVEDQLFGVSDADLLSRRIYELYGEVSGFGRAVHPLLGMISWLQRGYEKYEIDLELRRHMRDVLDNVTRVDERAEAAQALLDKALTVHTALVSREHTEVALRQDEQVKKISGWAAIIFAPSLIAAIYGMNFRYMPELDWPWGYPMAIAAMLAFAGALYAIFKSLRWM